MSCERGREGPQQRQTVPQHVLIQAKVGHPVEDMHQHSVLLVRIKSAVRGAHDRQKVHLVLANLERVALRISRLDKHRVLTEEGHSVFMDFARDDAKHLPNLVRPKGSDILRRVTPAHQPKPSPCRVDTAKHDDALTFVSLLVHIGEVVADGRRFPTSARRSRRIVVISDDDGLLSSSLENARLGGKTGQDMPRLHKIIRAENASPPGVSAVAPRPRQEIDRSVPYDRKAPCLDGSPLARLRVL